MSTPYTPANFTEAVSAQLVKHTPSDRTVRLYAFGNDSVTDHEFVLTHLCLLRDVSVLGFTSSYGFKDDIDKCSKLADYVPGGCSLGGVLIHCSSRLKEAGLLPSIQRLLFGLQGIEGFDVLPSVIVYSTNQCLLYCRTGTDVSRVELKVAPDPGHRTFLRVQCTMLALVPPTASKDKAIQIVFQNALESDMEKVLIMPESLAKGKCGPTEIEDHCPQHIRTVARVPADSIKTKFTSLVQLTCTVVILRPTQMDRRTMASALKEDLRRLLRRFLADSDPTVWSDRLCTVPMPSKRVAGTWVLSTGSGDCKEFCNLMTTVSYAHRINSLIDRTDIANTSSASIAGSGQGQQSKSAVTTVWVAAGLAIVLVGIAISLLLSG
eukprot:Clim_evm75s207 gene=Clim_evmTU75s207